jgi:hypothetical protein
MAESPEWQRSWFRRAQVALIAGAATPVIKALGATWRWRVEGRHHLEQVEHDGGRCIYAFWHGRILPGTVFFRDRGIVVITSENFDGEWIARIIRRFGYGTARGSTSRGGGKALLQLVRDVRSQPVAFTVDGPRGPARVAQPGAVWLSKATGAPILPFHFEASAAWSLRSWDRTQIPRPFTTVTLVIGESFVVPRETSDAQLEGWRQRLEQRLGECERRCTELARASERPTVQ